MWVPAESNHTVSCEAGPIRTHAAAALDRVHELSERAAELRESGSMLGLGEQSRRRQRFEELMSALSKLDRRVGVEHDAALFRGELVEQQVWRNLLGHPRRNATSLCSVLTAFFISRWRRPRPRLVALQMPKCAWLP